MLPLEWKSKKVRGYGRAFEGSEAEKRQRPKFDVGRVLIGSRIDRSSATHKNGPNAMLERLLNGHGRCPTSTSVMSDRGEANPTVQTVSDTKQIFPWSLGVYDAHCHPTDSMGSLEQVASMQARVLTVMATRSEDQHLVAEVAERWALETVQQLDGGPGCQVVPSFGWHPWFSHHLHDENGTEEPLTGEAKVLFFQRVLTPAPDDAFIASLPDPWPRSHYLADTKVRLAKYPLALVGEIGIDRSFRIPQSHAPAHIDEAEPAQTPGSRQGRTLSPYRVDLKHQAGLFQAQLNLAGEMRRAVSVHGVAAHGLLLEQLCQSWKGHERKMISRRRRKKTSVFRDETQDEDRRKAQDEDRTKAQDAKSTSSSSSKPYPPRVCLHSYSGPVNMVQQYLDPAIPTIIFFSFSEVINFSHAGVSKAEEVIRAVPDDRILVESDLHIAGKRMDGSLEAMVRRICHIKRWTLHDGVLQLGRNWRHFALGIVPE